MQSNKRNKRKERVGIVTSDKMDKTIIIPSDEFESPFDKLKYELGLSLFNQLSYQDKTFLVQTFGSIDFHRTIDLNKVAKNIEDETD